MPRLWNETIEAHRHDVREALLDTTAGLVAEGGLRAVTMSQIAEQTGIGRATLYKYFPDVESMLTAWHERQIREHLQLLSDVRESASDPATALRAVLETYAMLSHERHGSDVGQLLHQGDHIAHAHQHLRTFLADLITDAAATGIVSDGVSADELATYCVHALGAAHELRSKAAVRRLVAMTLAGLETSPR